MLFSVIPFSKVFAATGAGIGTYTQNVGAGDILEINGINLGYEFGSIKIDQWDCQIKTWTPSLVTCIVPDLPKYPNSDYTFSFKFSMPNGLGSKSFPINYLYKISSDQNSHLQKYLDSIKYTDVFEQYSGKGVTVAVIDSGIDLSNRDLQNNLWVNVREIQNNKIDDDNNGFVDDFYGYNFVENNANMRPTSNHGTMVAGIIAAEKNTIGIVGIAYQAKVMPLIVCSDRGCQTKDIINAIRYAADNGASIINLSISGNNSSLGFNPEYDDAIQYAYKKGVIIVVAAGNGDPEGAGTRGQNLNFLKTSPICNNNNSDMILGVAATDLNGVPTTWSNYGANCVNISAPGEGIYTTSVPVYSENKSFIYGDGTSFAAPMVAATAALLKEKNPSWKNWEIIGQILSHSKPLDNIDYGQFLNVKDILERKNPISTLTQVFPSKIDGESTLILYGKNFHRSMKLVIGNTQNYTHIPNELINFINGNQLQIDLTGLSSTLKPGGDKYYIASLIENDAIGSKLDNAFQIFKVGNKISTKTSEIFNSKDTTEIKKVVIEEKYVQINLKNLPLRLTPSSKGKVLLYTKYGEKYKIVEEQKDWIKIQTKNKVGWVMKRYIKIVK